MKLRVVITAFLSIIMFNLMSTTVHAESVEENGEPQKEYEYYLNYTQVVSGSDYHFRYFDWTVTSPVRIAYMVTGVKEIKNLIGETENTNTITLIYYNGDKLDNTLQAVHLNGTKLFKSNNGTILVSEAAYDTYWAHPYASCFPFDGMGSGYYDLKTNIPIFNSTENLKNYFLTGEISGALNIEVSSGEVYDDTLPGVKNLSLSQNNNCHGDYDLFNMCHNISWDIPENSVTYDKYEIKVLMKYNYTTYLTTKLYYGSALVDIPNDVYIRDGAMDLCAHDFAQILNLPVKNQNDYVNSFTIQEIQKIFIRTSRKEDEKIYYGDWYIYTVDKNKKLSLDYNKQYLGSGSVVSGDTEIDANGNIPDDTEIKDTIDAPERPESNFLFGIDFTNVGGVLSNFYSIIQNLMAAIGSFPNLFSTVFCFLPTEISSSVVLLFYVAIIIGLVKIFT